MQQMNLLLVTSAVHPCQAELRGICTQMGWKSDIMSLAHVFSQHDLHDLILCCHHLTEQLASQIDLVLCLDAKAALFFTLFGNCTPTTLVAFANTPHQINLLPSTGCLWKHADISLLPSGLFFSSHLKSGRLWFLYRPGLTPTQLLREAEKTVDNLREEDQASSFTLLHEPLPPLPPPSLTLVVSGLTLVSPRKAVMTGRLEGKLVSSVTVLPTERLFLGVPARGIRAALDSLLVHKSWLRVLSVKDLSPFSLLQLDGLPSFFHDTHTLLQLDLGEKAPAFASSLIIRGLKGQADILFYNFDLDCLATYQLASEIYFGSVLGNPGPVTGIELPWALILEGVDGLLLVATLNGGLLSLTEYPTLGYRLPSLAFLMDLPADILFFCGSLGLRQALRYHLAKLKRGVILVDAEEYGFVSATAGGDLHRLLELRQFVEERELAREIGCLLVAIGPIHLRGHEASDLHKLDLLYWASVYEEHRKLGKVPLFPSVRSHRRHIGWQDTDRQNPGGGRVYRPDLEEQEESEATPAASSETPSLSHRGVLELDFNHFYPSLIISQGISPEGKGILARLEERLIRQRAIQKGEGNRPFEMALKLLSNKIYGWLSHFFPALGGKVTGASRICLLRAISLCEDGTLFPLGWKVVYGDTDSLFVCPPPGQQQQPSAQKIIDTVASLNHILVKEYGAILTHKKTFTVMICGRGKKQYFGLTPEGTLHCSSLFHTFSNAPALSRRLMEPFLSDLCQLIRTLPPHAPLLSEPLSTDLSTLQARQVGLTPFERGLQLLLNQHLRQTLLDLTLHGTLEELTSTEHLKLQRYLSPHPGVKDGLALTQAYLALEGKSLAPTLTYLPMRHVTGGKGWDMPVETLIPPPGFYLDIPVVLGGGLIKPLHQALSHLLGLAKKPTHDDLGWMERSFEKVRGMVTGPFPLQAYLAPMELPKKKKGLLEVLVGGSG